MKKITLLLIIVSMFLMGCRRPYQAPVYVEVKPNETAFLVPLEDDVEKQVKLDSVSAYENAKVSAKRIKIPTEWEQTGRKDRQGFWKEMAMVILVDRSPISREWTENSSTGTSAANQAFVLESSESIVFTIAGNGSARIDEQDAAKFQYYYSGKTLDQIMDSDIRPYFGTRLSSKFSKLTTAECTEQKADLFTEAFEETKTYFTDFGITIMNLGMSGGMEYVDKEIQDGINKKVVAQQEVEIAESRRQAAEKVNQMNEEAAESQYQVALKYAKASKAQQESTALELEKRRVAIDETYAKAFEESWNGVMTGAGAGNVTISVGDGDADSIGSILHMGMGN